VKHNRLGSIARLAHAGTDVNARTSRGETVLHLLADYDVDEDTADAALSLAGIDIEAADDRRSTALYRVVAKNRIPIARILFAHGADLNARCAGDRTALHEAVRMNHVEMVQLLLERGAHVNVQDEDGRTPLMLACKFGHIGAARALLQQQWVNIHAVSSGEGLTALHEACKAGREDMAALMLDSGAGVNSRAEEWESARRPTPLHTACDSGHVGVVRLLVARGAALDVRDERGQSPFDLASLRGFHDVLLAITPDGA